MVSETFKNITEKIFGNCYMVVLFKNSYGFSLPEICVVLALTVVLTETGLSSLAQLRANQLPRTVKQLDLELTALAQRAVLTQNDAALSADDLRQMLPREIVLSQFKFGNLSGKPTLVFRANGSATAGTIVLSQHDGKNCKITVSLAGARKISC